MHIADWEFRFDDEAAWRPIAVPGCWEEAGYPKDRSGPAWYRAHPVVPPEWAGRRVFLRFGAVSYHCEVWINGVPRADHTGLWDPFTVEITDCVEPGAPFELLLRVEKPASLTGGPSSPPVPGRFPLKRTLSGFLPYVWGHMFGGVWQPVELVAAGPQVIEAAYARGAPDGAVEVFARLSAPGPVSVELHGPAGEPLATARLETRTEQEFEDAIAASAPALNSEIVPLASAAATSPEHVVRFDVQLPSPRPWSPQEPALYTAVLRVDGDERVIRFGLRSLASDGATLLLNGRPVYPRMALSWGWYADRLACDPGPERVRADFEKLRSLGYNGVKLCLWFPPPYYFELADELGMLLWVELPMWLPDPDEQFRRQVAVEYERLVRLARQHPSVILYSLGCELNRAVGPDILGPLYAMVKRIGGGALVRDNSGSGEAYGGLLNEFADYYDYHFYCDIQFFRNLVEYFSPRWRPPQPWIFGEFCDYDTFRIPPHPLPPPLPGEGETPGENRVLSSLSSSPPEMAAETRTRTVAWWASDDPSINPQGARWQFDVPFQEERLRANGLWERGAELERLSELHGLLHRKWTLEAVRTYREIAGYVVTGEVDTPISTAGMWDDAGRVKFGAEAFRAFNSDLVVTVGWDKRRDWVNGGDRAAYWDTFSYAAGAVVRPHLIASHYGLASGPATVSWSVALGGEEPFASGEAVTPFALAPGDLRELTVAEFLAPQLSRPRQGTLRATVRVGDEVASNEWPLWFFPKDPWAGLAGVALHDPEGRLEGLRRLAPVVEAEWRPAASPKVVIATAWSAELDALVRAGGRAVLLQAEDGPPGPVGVAAMPFWREAVRVCEPHPAWRDFPHDGWAGLQFYGCAADHALETAGLEAPVAPIVRRVDTRTMQVHDYAAELAWGAGRLLVSTLRLAGGHGDQPVGIARNTAAAYLLSCWVRYLML
jgi:hypothetical protein